MESSGLPSLLMQAAQSAAEADGVKPPPEKAASGEDAAAEGAAAAAVGGGKSEEGGKDAPNNSASDVNEGQNSTLDQMLASINGGANPSEVPSMGGSDPAPSNSAPPPQAPPEPAPAPAAEPTKKRAPLRRGKWTPEEEAYASRLIQEFKAGLLPLTDGTTLRTFLSKLLNCDPMRISKKFVGSNCIGKQVFRRRGADVNNLTPDEIEKTRFELSELEKKFLDRVAQNKGSKGGGGSSSSSSKKASLGGGGMSSGGGALGGMNSNMNKSAAAVGRALLQGNKAPQAQGKSNDGGNSSAGGLLAQLQAQQPGMFDNNTARSFLNASNSQAGLGNMNTNASITNLMLQTGMSRDQISQLAQKGISSSASLANMLGKQRSFDQLMSLDFQSMQSIDNLANLIQAGMPNQAGMGARIPKAQMKNMDWGTQIPQGNAFGNNVASGLLAQAGGSMKGSIENLVRTLSANSGSSGNAAAAGGNSNLANATNFGNLLQNAAQQGNLAGGGSGGGNDQINNILQTLQQQQQQNQQQTNNNLNYGNLLQNMGNNNAASLFQNNNANSLGGAGLGQNNSGNANDLMNMLSGAQNAAAGNLSQQNLNPLMQQLNNPLGNLQNAGGGGNDNNPMMAALAQQQLLAQAGGGNSMANLLGQQNGLSGLGMNMNNMNNSLGNLGALGGNLGGNLGNLGANLGGNFGSNNNQNTAALLQQLLAQQNAGGGANNNNNQATAIGAAAQGTNNGGGDNAAAGTKRSISDVSGGVDGNDSSKKPNNSVAL